MGPKRIRNTRNVVTANIVNSPNMPNLSPNNTILDTSSSRILPNNHYENLTIGWKNQ